MGVRDTYMSAMLIQIHFEIEHFKLPSARVLFMEMVLVEVVFVQVVGMILISRQRLREFKVLIKKRIEGPLGRVEKRN